MYTFPYKKSFIYLEDIIPYMRLEQSNKRKRFFQRRPLHILLHMYILTIYRKRTVRAKKEFSDSSHKGFMKSMWDFLIFSIKIKKIYGN